MVALPHHGVARCVQIEKSLLSPYLEFDASIGGADAARSAGEKLYAEGLLETRDPAAYDGFRDPQTGCGPAKAASLNDLDEAPDIVEF